MMLLPDLINGGFEMGTGLAAWHGAWCLYRDKRMLGFSKFIMPWVTAWGFWNLYYYPHLAQWLSFIGGVVVVSGNALFVALMLNYGPFGARLRSIAAYYGSLRIAGASRRAALLTAWVAR